MNRLTALVIEDDADVVRIFSRALRKAGFEVEAAYTGGQALKKLRTATPTLVVLDIALPEVSGTDILEHIRSDPRLSNTFVILATAYSHLVQTIKDKSDLVLLKPVSYIQLRDLSKRLATTVR